MASQKPPRLFVSHHSSKLGVAEHVASALAARGVSCWIAARDIVPGEPFDRAVLSAITDADAILLLFCSRAEKSRHVKRELILADDLGKAIIPLRLERIDPVELSYHLADSQWIDWIDRRDEALDRVAAKALGEGRRAPGAPAARPPADPPRVEAPARPAPPRKPRRWLPWALIGGGTALLALLVMLLLVLKGPRRVDDAFFVGTWSFARDCSDQPAEFLANGTIILADGTRGRYRVEDGQTLIATFPQSEVVIDFNRISDDEIDELSGPRRGRAYRCRN